MDIVLRIQYHEVVAVITDQVMRMKHMNSPEDYSKIHVQANYNREVSSIPSFTHFIVSSEGEDYPFFYFDTRQTFALVLEYVQQAHEFLKGLHIGYSFVLTPIPEGRVGERSFSNDYILGYMELVTLKVPFPISHGE